MGWELSLACGSTELAKFVIPAFDEVMYGVYCNLKTGSTLDLVWIILNSSCSIKKRVSFPFFSMDDG